MAGMGAYMATTASSLISDDTPVDSNGTKTSVEISVNPAFSPYTSLKAAFESKRSNFFGIKMEDRHENFGNGNAGIRLKRIPRDPKTLYTAGGVSGEEEPHSFFLSFEITNNRHLCSVSSTGLLQNPCIYSRLIPYQRRGTWFDAEELLGGSPWGFGLRQKGEPPVRLPMTHGATVEMLATIFQIFNYQQDNINAQLLAFAPQTTTSFFQNPRAILAVVSVQNQGKTSWEGSLLAPNLRDLSDVNSSNGVAMPVESPHPRFTEHPVPIKPGYEAIICLDGSAWNPTCPEIAFKLAPDQDRTFCFGLLLAENVDALHETGRQIRQQSVLKWLNETARGRTERYGELVIPSDS
jgi:hypothetical protein